MEKLCSGVDNLTCGCCAADRAVVCLDFNNGEFCYEFVAADERLTVRNAVVKKFAFLD